MLPYLNRALVLFRPTFYAPIRAFSSEKESSLSEGSSFETEPYKLHILEEGPSTSATVNKEDALKFYTQMSSIRRMENGAATLYKAKIIRGFCHLYAGQEAVCVGIHSQLKTDLDSVITSYRAHGWTWIMGETIASLLAELAGKESGVSRGKGGSMHTYAPNFYGGNGIVGAHVPLGTGCAFAHKYTEKGALNVCLYGDGAANQGQVYEAWNIAKLWNLPVIYVCENNKYGMGTSTRRASADDNFYKRVSYMPGIWVDGMDVLAVRECFRFATKYVREGKGPIVVETSTYRYFGHSMSDPGTSYRSREEIQETRQTKDPINKFKDKIVSANLVTEDELKAIDAKLKQEVDEAMNKAKSDKEPAVDALTTDVYSQYPWALRGVGASLPSLPHKRVGKAINLK
ncbi:unnamed protein product [Acanthoscelides obtectus]|uniref:Pyruvate dehydrogenase E1 component subunit alpha n=1 Tax=Acanthoscelides obtectus TaxID=200917 RepID=A0A9P0JKH5_ACAOB|nr:unnamed protein product [Acanthoscelides obtectus]CAK1657995.1 Probable pyruvate dehydrogenase E1 component subunit alpha, mitochondrial [Acanthoscelides obtectus]